MKLSVITVCKNAARTIERTIQSVAEQTYSDIEFIVLDGASDDGTQAIVERHRGKVTRFVSEPDGGIYSAMNKGIRVATGDYLYFLNADDYLVDANVLADVAGFLEKHPGCDFVYGNINIVRLNGHVVPLELPPPERVLEFLITGCLPHQGSFARAGLFQTIGAFDESYPIVAEYDWFLRLMLRTSLEICHYPRTIAYFSEGGLSHKQTRRSATEMFQVQNRAAVYQTDSWRQERLLQYQKAIVYYRELLAHGNQEGLVEQLRQANKTIAYMEGSKFWKLRKGYLGLRRLAARMVRMTPRPLVGARGWVTRRNDAR